MDDTTAVGGERANTYGQSVTRRLTEDQKQANAEARANRPKKKYLHKPLPSAATLHREYMQPGVNFAVLAERYGWSTGVITRIVKDYADEQGLAWPLKTQSQTPKRRESVPVKLARDTLRDVVRRYRISLPTVAEHVDLNLSVVRSIASACKRPNINRSTQGAILEFASKLDAGELVLPRETVRLRDEEYCGKGHRYGPQRDSRGYRICVVCRAAKALRAYPKTAERRAAQKAQSDAA